jgi:hypothetical protein
MPAAPPRSSLTRSSASPASSSWLDGTRAQLAVVPEGKNVQDLTVILDKYLPKPLRRRGTATLTDAASFVAHLNRFASRSHVVFANPDRAKPSLTSVFDYHPEGRRHRGGQPRAPRGLRAGALRRVAGVES